MATRRSPLLALLLVLGVLGCEAQFDETFVIQELSIIGVQTAVQSGDREYAELVISTNALRMMNQMPALPQVIIRVLAVQPEAAGGQDAIERYHWAIGDPPMEGVPSVVTTIPEVVIEHGSVIPALAAVITDGEELTPQALADRLDEGPILVPVVVTVIAGEDSAKAVKMFTIRAQVDPEDEPNRNPLPEGLTMGDVEWSEEFFEVIGAQPSGPHDIQRNDEVVFDVDPDDPGDDDGDVETTLYVTGGTIGWSPDSMRVWVQQTPGEDYEPDQLRVFLTLRDPQGGQGWFTILQDLGP